MKNTSTKSNITTLIPFCIQMLKETKSQIKCSNDIIPCAELPVFFPIEIPNYISRFGEEKVTEFIDWIEYAKYIHEHLQKIFKESSTAFPSPVTTTCIASGLLGGGECQVLANYLACLLLKKAPEKFKNISINAILLEGYKANTIAGDIEPYEHAMIILGDLSTIDDAKQGSILEVFKKLKDCIFIDPLLGVVCETQQLEKYDAVTSYYKSSNFDKITDIMSIEESNLTGLKVLWKNAEYICDLIKPSLPEYKKQGQIRAQKILFLGKTAVALNSISNISQSRATLFSPDKVTEAHTNLLAEVENLQRSGSILPSNSIEAIKDKDYSLALRKACSLGHEQFFDILLKYDKQLPFDFKKASTNNRTPLDWVTHSNVDDKIKHRMIVTLLEKGATSGEMLSFPAVL